MERTPSFEEKEAIFDGSALVKEEMSLLESIVHGKATRALVAGFAFSTALALSKTESVYAGEAQEKKSEATHKQPEAKRNFHIQELMSEFFLPLLDQNVGEILPPRTVEDYRDFIVRAEGLLKTIEGKPEFSHHKPQLEMIIKQSQKNIDRIENAKKQKNSPEGQERERQRKALDNFLDKGGMKQFGGY